MQYFKTHRILICITISQKSKINKLKILKINEILEKLNNNKIHNSKKSKYNNFII